MKAFCSSDPAEVKEFLARPFSNPGAAFTAAEIAAMRASLDMAQMALDDLRAELATERAEKTRCIARMRMLEAERDEIRRLVK